MILFLILSKLVFAIVNPSENDEDSFVIGTNIQTEPPELLSANPKGGGISRGLDNGIMSASKSWIIEKAGDGLYTIKSQNKAVGFLSDKGDHINLNTSLVNRGDLTTWNIEKKEKNGKAFHKIKSVNGMCLTFHNQNFHLEPCGENNLEQEFVIKKAIEKGINKEKEAGMGQGKGGNLENKRIPGALNDRIDREPPTSNNDPDNPEEVDNKLADSNNRLNERRTSNKNDPESPDIFENPNISENPENPNDLEGPKSPKDPISSSKILDESIGRTETNKHVVATNTSVNITNTGITVYITTTEHQVETDTRTIYKTKTNTSTIKSVDTETLYATLTETLLTSAVSKSRCPPEKTSVVCKDVFEGLSSENDSNKPICLNKKLLNKISKKLQEDNPSEEGIPSKKSRAQKKFNKDRCFNNLLEKISGPDSEKDLQSSEEDNESSDKKDLDSDTIEQVLCRIHTIDRKLGGSELDTNQFNIPNILLPHPKKLAKDKKNKKRRITRIIQRSSPGVEDDGGEQEVCQSPTENKAMNQHSFQPPQPILLPPSSFQQVSQQFPLPFYKPPIQPYPKQHVNSSGNQPQQQQIYAPVLRAAPKIMQNSQTNQMPASKPVINDNSTNCLPSFPSSDFVRRIGC